MTMLVQNQSNTEHRAPNIHQEIEYSSKNLAEMDTTGNANTQNMIE